MDQAKKDRDDRVTTKKEGGGRKGVDDLELTTLADRTLWIAEDILGIRFVHEGRPKDLH